VPTLLAYRLVARGRRMLSAALSYRLLGCGRGNYLDVMQKVALLHTLRRRAHHEHVISHNVGVAVAPSHAQHAAVRVFTCAGSRGQTSMRRTGSCPGAYNEARVPAQRKACRNALAHAHIEAPHAGRGPSTKAEDIPVTVPGNGTTAA
jgi:hypothetical protein